jgi:hypothetical protein
MNRLSRSLKRANRRAMEEMSQIYNALSETLSGIKVVKAFTMERYELTRIPPARAGPAPELPPATATPAKLARPQPLTYPRRPATPHKRRAAVATPCRT